MSLIFLPCSHPLQMGYHCCTAPKSEKFPLRSWWILSHSDIGKMSVGHCILLLPCFSFSFLALSRHFLFCSWCGWPFPNTCQTVQTPCKTNKCFHCQSENYRIKNEFSHLGQSRYFLMKGDAFNYRRSVKLEDAIEVPLLITKRTLCPTFCSSTVVFQESSHQRHCMPKWWRPSFFCKLRKVVSDYSINWNMRVVESTCSWWAIQFLVWLILLHFVLHTFIYNESNGRQIYIKINLWILYRYYYSNVNERQLRVWGHQTNIV